MDSGPSHSDKVAAGKTESSFPKPLRILCFGDSLTAGYTMMGMEHYPYADHLHLGLVRMLRTTDIHVDVEGRSGDQVQDLYLKRLRRKLEAAPKPYNWVIIMGGTNDLGWGQQPTDIYENLKKVWELALDTGANVLALNVIEAARSSTEMVKKRNWLNDMIVHHEEDRFYAFDLWSAIRYSTLDDIERERIWDDGLHLTGAGYRMMGEAIAAHMVKLLTNT